MANEARKTRARPNRHMFSSSYDSATMNQILATHAPVDGHIDLRPLLNVVRDIFHRSAFNIPAIVQGKPFDETASQFELVGTLQILSPTINKISTEIWSKCLGGGDAHGTTMGILGTLRNYTWDAKVGTALAAFAVNFGEFRLVAQLYATDPVAKAIAALKQIPEILEKADSLKHKYEAIGNLINAMMDVTNCIVEFEELPSRYISPDSSEMLTAITLIPMAVYWTIRSIVACASQISGIVGLVHEHMSLTTETWELPSLAHKLSNIHGHLRKQLFLCQQHIDNNKKNEAFQTLLHLFGEPQQDNLKILNALIHIKDDMLPLLDGSSKSRVGMDVLRWKITLLLISDLDLSDKELMIFEQMYLESREEPTRFESQYEVVWLPVVDNATPWTEAKLEKFKDLQSRMPWYSVHELSPLEPAVIKYMKEVWRFNKKPKLVVLDQQGNVINPNAINMMWIWGSLAYPFTSSREQALWQEETWRLDLLADTLHPSLATWIPEGKYICLYGGEDMNWIRKFTGTAHTAAKALQLPLEMIYMGKSNPGERVRENNNAIDAEMLSHVLPDLTLIWFFWVRLGSMWYSKIQQGMTVEKDPIMKEIVTFLSFDGSDEGWAVIGRGTEKMAQAKGETFLKCLNDCDQWKDNAKDKGMLPAMDDYIQGLRSRTPHRCNRLILPASDGSIPEKIACAECGHLMDRFFEYRCCND